MGGQGEEEVETKLEYQPIYLHDHHKKAHNVFGLNKNMQFLHTGCVLSWK